MTENVVFAFPNYADADYYAPVLSGGAWEADLPLSNLQDPLLSKVARSADAAAASTRFHLDLGVERDLRLFSLHGYNFGRAAAVRMRASRQIAWTGVQLAAAATATDTTISVECPGGTAMIRAGDSFTLGGANYTVTTPLALGGNLATDSEDLAAGWWSPFVSTVSFSADAAEAPDGTQTADLVVPSAATGAHKMSGSESGLGIAGRAVTTSWFVRPGGFHLQVDHNWDGEDAVVTFDLDAAAVAETDVDSGCVLESCGVTALPGGWLRVHVTTSAADPAAVLGDVEFQLLGSDFSDSFAGDGAAGMSVWGYQLEYGPLTTYKKSGATPAYHTTSGTVGVTPALADDADAGDALACLCGEYVGTAPAVDSGWYDVWPVVYDWYLPWEHPSFWDGRIPEEQRVAYPKNTHYLAPATGNARYALVEVDDAANADGHVDVGRLFAAPALQPGRNFSYGAQLGWKSNSQKKQSLGGAGFTDRRPSRRVMTFRLEQLGAADALEGVYEMFRRLDVDGQVYVILTPDATTHLPRVSMLATLADLTPLDLASLGRYTAYFQLEEVIA